VAIKINRRKSESKCFDDIRTFHPEDGGNKILRNVGILPHRYTVS